MCATDQFEHCLEMPGPSMLPKAQRQHSDNIHQHYVEKGKRPIKISEKARQVIHIYLIFWYLTGEQELG
jgi:hypothetical protein